MFGTTSIPGPPLWSAPRYAYNLFRDPFKVLVELRETYGDVVSIERFGVPKTFFIAHPDGIKRIFYDNNKNYVRGANFRNVENVVGYGIVVSEGDFWRRQRKQVQPALALSVVNTQVDAMGVVVESMLKRWNKHAGGWLDIAEEMREVTRRVALKIMLGIDLEKETAELSKTWEQMYDALTEFTTNPWKVPLSIPTPWNRHFQRVIGELNRRVYEVIGEHRRSPDAPGDLVRALIAARDPVSGKPMTERQLRDELVTVVSAGFDTSAVTLGWTWYLLSQHPWAERKLAEEVRQVIGDRRPTAAELMELKYTKMVLQESMRLFPAAWVLTRTSVADDEICGHKIPGGSMIVTSAYVTHRHPDVWENPEVFDPERFSRERSANRSRFAFFPFGDGPRKCPGEHFSLAEMLSVLAMVSQRYRLHMKPDHPIELEPSFTLRAKHGLPMRLEPKAPAAAVAASSTAV